MNTPAAQASRKQLLLPPMGALFEMGGKAHAGDVIATVADRLGVPPEVANDFKEVDLGKWGTRRRSAFRQEVHWARHETVAVAWNRWPGERLYTFVNPAEVKSHVPGACFRAAGWRSCGTTKGGLLIMERHPI